MTIEIESFNSHNSSPSNVVKTLYQWNRKTQKYDLPYRVSLARPEHWGERGASICAICGGKTHIVLDGEAWCGHCGLYQ